MYVGQSVNVLARVGQHAGDLSKMFHGVSILECERDALDDLEGLLIQSIAPPLNTSLGTHPKFVKSTQHWGRVPKRIRDMTPIKFERTQAREVTGLEDLIRHVQNISKLPDQVVGYANATEAGNLMGGMSAQALKSLSEREGFPSHKKIGGRLVWNRAAIIEWIAQKEAGE